MQDTPARLPLKEVAPGTQVLDAESKLVNYGVHMSAYNGESVLARLLAPHYRRAEDEGRALLREAFRASGSLGIVGGNLEVCLDPGQHLAVRTPSPPSATGSTRPRLVIPARNCASTTPSTRPQALHEILLQCQESWTLPSRCSGLGPSRSLHRPLAVPGFGRSPSDPIGRKPIFCWYLCYANEKGAALS